MALRSVKAQTIAFAAACFAVATPVEPTRAEAAQWLALGASYESYFANQESLYGKQNYQLFSGRYSGDTRRSWLSGRLDAGGIFGANVSSYSIVYVPEAYLQFHQRLIAWLPQEITFGRMKESWSRLDEDWQLGLVQPMIRFDYLRPEQQGLTGAFLTWKTDRARLVLFASGVYIPEQGPPFEIKNGEISSASPWFTEPANELILYQQPTEITYRIETPGIPDIVLRGSLGGLFVLGGRDSAGPWSSGGYISKPRNSLMVPFTAPLVLGPSAQFAEVTVFPRVERHHVAVFDIGYRSGFESAWISALAEFPQNPAVDADITRQRIEPQVLISPAFETRFFSDRSWAPRAQLAYLHQDGGETVEEGPFATDRGTIFSSPMSWTRATSLSLKSQVLQTAESTLDVNVRWIEDFRQRGTCLMTEVLYVPSRNWLFSINADFIGSAAPVADQSGLINRYRGNDRFAGGVRYVF